MANLVTFVAKHPFQGDPKQSQLSFPQGAKLTAKADQVGNSWWWGSYNGREGWFPPAYVTPMGGAPPPQQMPQTMNPQMSMQQRMQQATFASSVQQKQQQRQPVVGSGYPQQPATPQSFGAPPPQQQPGFGAPMPQQQQGFPQQQGFGGVPSPATPTAAATPDWIWCCSASSRNAQHGRRSVCWLGCETDTILGFINAGKTKRNTVEMSMGSLPSSPVSSFHVCT